LRADIDFGTARALYPGAGIIGVKVWIYRGEQ
jgi:ribosomal protein S3